MRRGATIYLCNILPLPVFRARQLSPAPILHKDWQVLVGPTVMTEAMHKRPDTNQPRRYWQAARPDRGRLGIICPKFQAGFYLHRAICDQALSYMHLGPIWSSVQDGIVTGW